jgi:WD40 repeat protein
MTRSDRKSLWLLLACLLPATVAAADENKPITEEDPGLGRAVDFDRDVRPILQANCVACHNVTTNEGGVILETVDAMLKSKASSAVVTAGKPEESLLFTLSKRSVEPVMPPLPNDRQAKALSGKELGIVRQWITEGAKAGSGAAKVMNWQPINARLQGVYSMDIDSHGRFIAAGRANRVTVYDLARQDVPAGLVDPSIVSSAAQGPTGAAHRDFVHAVAFHPAGSMIATTGYRNIKLWQRDASPAPSMPLPADVTAWSLTSDNSELVLAVPGRGVVVMNSATGAERATAGLDGQAVSAVTVVAGWILAAQADQRVAVLKTADLSLAHRTEPLPAPITALGAELTGGKAAALLADGSIRLLAVAADTGVVTVAAEIRSDAGAITRISGGGPQLLTVAGTKTVQLWKAEDGTQAGRFDTPADITAVDARPAAERAVFVFGGATASLWSLKENKEIAALTANLTAQRDQKSAEFRKAVLDSRVNVIKAQIDEADKEITAQKEAETKAKADVEKQTPIQAEAKKKFDEAAAKTAEAKKTLEGKPDDAALKTAVTEAEKAEAAAKDALTKADSDLNTAKKSVDFAVAAIGRAEKRAAERRQQHEAATAEATAATATVEEKKTAAAVPAAAAFAALTSDGRFALCSDAAGLIRLWNAAAGVPVDVLPTAVSAPVTAVSATAGSALLKTADHRLTVRSLFPAWTLARSIGSEDGGESVFADRVLSLAFSPDGTLLAAGGGEASRTGELTLWNVADGTLARQFPDAHSDTVYGLEFSADGRLLASASADKFVKVFDVAAGTFVRAFEGHTHHVMDVSWKSDRTTLASAGADNAIKIWNVDTGEQARTISTYTRQVTSLQYVGLQDLILSSSGDKRVFFHNPSNGGAAREFPGNADYVYRAAATPDGTLVVSGGEDGTVRVWNAADAKVVATFAAAP